MENRIETWINDLLTSRHMSMGDLTAFLGYSSKTSLVRIMKGQVNQRAAETFAQRIKQNITLTPQQRAEFEEAMNVLRWQKDYAASREIMHFLCGQDVQDGEVWLEDVESGCRMPMFERYQHMKDIRITLMNGQYVALFGALTRLVKERGAQVKHYLQMGEDCASVIHALHKLIPLIFEKGYAGYCYRYDELGEVSGVRGMVEADAMAVEYIAEDGALREDMVVFDSPEHGMVRTCEGHGSCARMLSVRHEDYEPVKRVFFQKGGWGNYIQFIEGYARLEHNRAEYIIKPDVSMEWVPGDILVNAVFEGGQLSGDEDFSQLAEEFQRVQGQRVRNTFEKRQVTKAILKRNAMIRFAKTGKLSDHFWGMRPFTPEERVRILKLLRSQMENNPYFNIYFLKDNAFLREAWIAYYDGLGLLMMPEGADYALAGNHSEVLIVHNEFVRMFKEYYNRTLLTEHVTSQQEALNFMGELIRIAER